MLAAIPPTYYDDASAIPVVLPKLVSAPSSVHKGWEVCLSVFFLSFNSDCSIIDPGPHSSKFFKTITQKYVCIFPLNSCCNFIV